MCKHYSYCDHEILTNLASKSDMRSKHAAVIVNRNRIISWGHNQTVGSTKRYCSRENINRPLSLHAEEHALRNSNHRELRGSIMYVIRWGVHDDNPTFMNSKPCERCMNSINKMKRYGLKAVYYSIDTDEEGRPIWGQIILD